MYEKNMSDMSLLFESNGWSFTRQKDGLAIIIHNDCRQGLSIRSGGSVMHWKTHVCQQCKTRPPVELIGAYILHNWDDRGKMNTFSEEVYSAD